MPPKPPKPPLRIPARPSKPSAPRAIRPPPFQPQPAAPSRNPRNAQSHPSTDVPPLFPHGAPPFPRIRKFFANPFVRFTAYTVVGASTLLWIRDHHIDYMRVNGSSMAPTLNARYHEAGEKELVIIRPYSDWDGSGGEGDLKRGDIVTFWKPRNARELGIKRVVGVEGDEIYPESGYATDVGGDGREYLKGIPDGLHDYDEDSIASERSEKGKITVPYGHIWVEGDNARSTLDSRDNGPISKKLVVGRAVRVWRGWDGFQKIGDDRNKKERGMGSRVVEGRGIEVPVVYLE